MSLAALMNQTEGKLSVNNVTDKFLVSTHPDTSVSCCISARVQMNNSKVLYSSVLCVSLLQTTWTSFTASGQTLCQSSYYSHLYLKHIFLYLLHLQLKNTPLARGDEQKQSWTLSSRRSQRHVWIKNIDNNSPTKKLCNLKTISNAQNKGTAT